jgi:syntaxin-binding protein 1
LDRDGKNISPIKILNQVGLKILNESLDDFDKLRLLLITTICLEMVEKDRKTLTDKIKYENQKALLNLIHLGVNPQKGASKKVSFYFNDH